MLVVLGRCPAPTSGRRTDDPRRAALAVGDRRGRRRAVATAQPFAAGAQASARADDGLAPIFDFDALLGAQRSDGLASGRTIEPDDTAAYFHTGGTTGTPKLVRHTHANQVYQAW